MEILLLQDVNGIGKKHDLLVVGDGFALNYLLPQRVALVATPTIRKRYLEQIKRRAMEREYERELKLTLAQNLAGKSVKILRKATKTGKLYAAVSVEELAKALKDQHGIDVPVEFIEIAEPIKNTGTAHAQVKLENLTQTLTVTIEAEKAEK